MNRFTQNLHLTDEPFDKMREDADAVIQKLIKKMMEANSDEGKISISIEVSMIRNQVMDTSGDKGGTRYITMPKFSHKVNSVIQYKDEEKGNKEYTDMELVYDSKTDEWVLKPIANTEQRSIFDSDFDVVDTQQPVDEPPVLEGSKFDAMPEPVDYDESEDDDYGYEE